MPEDVQVEILGKISSLTEWLAKQAGQGSGGVTIPGAIQKMCGCGT